MSAPPLISIWIPTRGRPDLVPRAVASVLAQSHANLELIVVLDGPDEDTLKALQRFGDDERFQVMELPESRGACQARNHAILHAQGEWVTGLDDDDEFLPEHLETLLRAVNQGDYSFSCTTSVLYRSEYQTVRHRFEGIVDASMLARQNVVGNQVLTRTAHLRELGGFDAEMPAWQDYELWFRLVHKFGPGVRVDAQTYIQHLDHEHERISQPERIQRAHERFVNKHADRLDESARSSLELLEIATTHRPFSLGEAVRLTQHNSTKRVLSAFVSNHFPALRKPVRELQSRWRQRWK